MTDNTIGQCWVSLFKMVFKDDEWTAWSNVLRGISHGMGFGIT